MHRISLSGPSTPAGVASTRRNPVATAAIAPMTAWRPLRRAEGRR